VEQFIIIAEGGARYKTANGELFGERITLKSDCFESPIFSVQPSLQAEVKVIENKQIKALKPSNKWVKSSSLPWDIIDLAFKENKTTEYVLDMLKSDGTVPSDYALGALKSAIYAHRKKVKANVQA
jgi:hypothetical protein